MSILKVDQLQAQFGTTITVPNNTNFIASGHVLQVVSNTFAGTWSAAGQPSTFYPVSDLNTAITPRSATSKILITTSMSIGSGYWEIQGRFTRNGTAIGLGNQRGSRTRCTFLDNRYEAAGSVRNGWGTVSAQFLDSPNTTSLITYGVELNGYSTFTIGVNYNPYSDSDSSDYFGTPISVITLTEIAQ